MTVTPDFRAWVEEQLGRVTPVTTRHMFGGLGIYAEGLFFALAHDNQIYFKVGDENRADFEARGCQPFRPYGDERTMPYYEVPAEVLEDVELLGKWVAGSLAVARAKKSKKKR